MSHPEILHPMVLLDQTKMIDAVVVGLLREQGFQPYLFSRVSDACQAILDLQPSLIIFAPTSPDPSNMKICAQLTGCRLPGQDRLVVLCSDVDCEVEKAAALGIDDLISAPLEWPSLVRRLKLTALRVHQNQTEVQKTHADLYTPSVNNSDQPDGSCEEGKDDSRVLLLAGHHQRAQEILGSALKKQPDGAILLVQIHALSGIFRSYGYSKGARLLARFSKLLTGCLRADDSIVDLNETNSDPTMVAQIADADFAVLLSAGERPMEFEVLSTRIRQTIGNHITIDDENIPLVFSFGYAAWPNDGGSADEILLAACKSARKMGATGHAPLPIAENQSQLLSSLYDAISQQQIQLFYQPRVAAGSGKIMGFEALARWECNGQMIPPEVFISAAENYGLIQQLGLIVAETAIAQHQRWENMGLGRIPVAINVSPFQFDDKHFSERLLEICQKYSTDPSNIEIEITESSVLRNESATLEQLKTLRDAGMRVALDDFGTGYSSLSHLQRLELDALKIDRSFIHKLTDPTSDPGLVVSIIGIGINLGLSVVAEGVEELCQAEMLYEWGCHELQGYYFSRPVNAEEATKLLAHSQLPPGQVKLLHSGNDDYWPAMNEPENCA